MPDSKEILSIFLTVGILSAGFALPVLAAAYNPGVTAGQYVKYGNFVGVGPGVESFNDYDWLKLEVTNVLGKAVTLLSIGQFKNGTAIPGNGSTVVWNVEMGTEDGIPRTQGPIIAANLNQGDPIPPPNTYSINLTENQVYRDVTRIVNILNVTIFTSYYNSTLTYAYDRTSGMLLESFSQTTTQFQPQPVTSTYSYSVIETNIFGFSVPSPTVPEFTSPMVILALVTVLAVVAVIVFKKNFRLNQHFRI